MQCFDMFCFFCCEFFMLWRGNTGDASEEGIAGIPHPTVSIKIIRKIKLRKLKKIIMMIIIMITIIIMIIMIVMPIMMI